MSIEIAHRELAAILAAILEHWNARTLDQEQKNGQMHTKDKWQNG